MASISLMRVIRRWQNAQQEIFNAGKELEEILKEEGIPVKEATTKIIAAEFLGLHELRSFADSLKKEVKEVG